MSVKKIKFKGQKRKIRLLDPTEIIPEGAYYVYGRNVELTQETVRSAVESKCPGDVVCDHPERTYFVVIPFGE